MLASGNENLYSRMRFIFRYRKEVLVNTKKDTKKEDVMVFLSHQPVFHITILKI